MFQFDNCLSILIKATDECNLRCIYCFHKNEGYKNGILSYNDLDKLYSIVFPYYKCISIVWHGGEPLCAGLPFYEKAIKMQKSYIEKFNNKVKNSMQTNGTLITKDIISFAKRNNIGIGISYDGIVNDKTRASSLSVKKSRQLLKENGINAGVITVVSRINIDKLLENYLLMKEEKCNIQLNHYIEMDKCNPDKTLQLSVKEYVDKMFNLFLYWIKDESCNIDVQPFSHFLCEVFFKSPAVCTRSSCLRNWICMDHNGNLSPCDKSFPKEFTYGNINDFNDIRQIYETEGFKKLISGAIERRKKCIDECDIFDYCQGGCNHSALIESGLENNKGFSCIAFRDLFKKIIVFCEENNITAKSYTTNIKNPYLIKVLNNESLKYEK